AKDGVEILDPYYSVRVSDRVVSAVRTHQLTGIELSWFDEKTRTRERRDWFDAMSFEPLGRGIDHPWFEPSTMRNEGGQQTTDPVERIGIRFFYNSQLKPGTPAEPLLRR